MRSLSQAPRLGGLHRASRLPFKVSFFTSASIRQMLRRLLGFSGPREEAEQIKIQLAEFLRDHLNLELSKEKTLITHARTEAARFLGYEIVSQDADDKYSERSD
jgi:hypothetical protein